MSNYNKMYKEAILGLRALGGAIARGGKSLSNVGKGAKAVTPGATFLQGAGLKIQQAGQKLQGSGIAQMTTAQGVKNVASKAYQGSKNILLGKQVTVGKGARAGTTYRRGGAVKAIKKWYKGTTEGTKKTVKNIKGQQAAQSAANKQTIKNMSSKGKNPPKKKPAKQEGFLTELGGGLVGKGSTEGTKQLAGAGAIVGGGYLAKNILGEEKSPEQGIFFKGGSLNRSAGTGGAVLGSLTKTSLFNEGGNDIRKNNINSSVPKSTKPNFNLPGTSKKPKDIKTNIMMDRAMAMPDKLAQSSFVSELDKHSFLAAVGKSVAKTVKGTQKGAKPAKGAWVNRKNVAKSLSKNPELTGAATLAAGALAVKKI